MTPALQVGQVVFVGSTRYQITTRLPSGRYLAKLEGSDGKNEFVVSCDPDPPALPKPPPVPEVPLVRMKMVGRRDPYKVEAISGAPCVRCGGKSSHQWSVCDRGNVWMAVCVDCDAQLNALVMKFMRLPESDKPSEPAEAAVP